MTFPGGRARARSWIVATEVPLSAISIVASSGTSAVREICRRKSGPLPQDKTGVNAIAASVAAQRSIDARANVGLTLALALALVPAGRAGGSFGAQRSPMV